MAGHSRFRDGPVEKKSYDSSYAVIVDDALFNMAHDWGQKYLS